MLLQANTDETEMPSDPRFQIAKLMDGFVKRFGQVSVLLSSSFMLFAHYSIAIRGYISVCLSQPMSRSPHTLSHCGRLGSPATGGMFVFLE